MLWLNKNHAAAIFGCPSLAFYKHVGNAVDYAALC